MKELDQTAAEINTSIQRWSKDRTCLVVSIDGYAGIGKTSIVERLAEVNQDILPVHLDDFIQHWQVRKQLIEEAADKPAVFEYKWYRYDVVLELLQAFKKSKDTTFSVQVYDYDLNDFGQEKKFDLSKKVLVIDGIFTLHPKHDERMYIDKSIYLTADFAEIDKRRIARDKKRWGDSYLPEDHPDNWIRYFIEAYKKYVDTYHPDTAADAVFAV